MKRSILSVVVSACLLSISASAEPVKLTKDQMDKVVAGAITTTTTTTQINGGGQTPKGSANGVPTVTTTISTNPTGKAPPGQN